MKSLALIAALCCAAVPAYATDWRPVIADAGTLIFLVDAETLPTAKQPQPTARALMVFAQGVRTDFQAMEMTTQFDCAGNRVRMIRTVAFDEQGRSIGDESPADAAWNAIQSESGFAGLAEVICGKRSVSTQKLAGAVPIAEARKLIGTVPAE